MKKDFSIINIAKRVLESESESLRHTANHITTDFEDAVSLIWQSKGKLVVTGIGKSAHIANKIVATLNSTGTVAVFLHAAEAIHGDLGIIEKDDVVLCISKSGDSPEIQALLPIIKNFGNSIIGITAKPNSALGTFADFVIDCSIEEESCPNNLAPTNSTTVQLALGDALAVCLMQLKNFTANDFAKYHPGGALGKNLLLKVSDILLNTEPPKVSEQSSMNEIIYEISSKRLGATAVVENNKILGIITDGDLRRMLEKQLDINEVCASMIMTKNPVTITKDTYLRKALELLESKKITQLLVVDEDNNYQGIIHLYDILKEGIAL